MVKENWKEPAHELMLMKLDKALSDAKMTMSIHEGSSDYRVNDYIDNLKHMRMSKKNLQAVLKRLHELIRETMICHYGRGPILRDCLKKLIKDLTS